MAKQTGSALYNAMKHRRNTENGPERKDKEVYTLLHGTILSYTLRHHLRGTPNVSVYLATIHRRKTITSPSKEKNDYTTMRIVRCASVFGKATLIHIAADGIDDSRTTDGRKEARDRAKQTKPAVSLAGTREWDVPSCTNSDAKKKKKKKEKRGLAITSARTQQGYTTIPPVSSRRGVHSPRNARMNTSETERGRNAGLQETNKLNKCFFAWPRKRSPRRARQ